MKPPKCRLCGHEHYGLAHVFASNKESASNRASNRETVKAVDAGVLQPVARVSARGADGGSEGGEYVANAPKQRWSREAYNKYQKELMRNRRAKQKEGVK